MFRNIIIFGATGSIGTSALKVISRHRENFKIVGITGNRNVENLAQIAKNFNVQNVGIFDKKFLSGKESLFKEGTRFFFAEDGFCELATLPSADSILMAIVGTDGLLPTMRAIESKKEILLASKEILVVAGKFVIKSAQKHGIKLLPIDSEHNAIFQCLQGNDKKSVEKVILTASGGPFMHYTEKAMEYVTVEQALKHPTWNMGEKITIDSATLANKGLEIIEARWLFNIIGDKIDVIIHPESIIHSMVQFCDGSLLAQMSPPNMEFAIANCLFHPERKSFLGDRVNFCKLGTLTFFHPDLKKFPNLSLAKECLDSVTNACAVFQAANEVAVESFLNRKIKFNQINSIIAKTLNLYGGEYMNSLESCLYSYKQGKMIASGMVV